MKMAIVGCEASGKTVFMCALADYYGQDAVNNPLRLKLTPENAAANSFERFQFRQMRCLRQWPPATPPERNIEIKWTLRRDGNALANIDMLEFGGETYRVAFRSTPEEARQDETARGLLDYLQGADFFVVLVSIKALLTDLGAASEQDFDRETEALWVTRGIIEFIRKNRPNAGVVIGLTQADLYRNEIADAGGAQQLFTAHWPTVAAAAQGYPIVEVASVSKTDEHGNPAEGYRTHGIQPVMRAFAKHCFGDENALENGSNLKFQKPPRKITLASALVALGIAGVVAAGAIGLVAHRARTTRIVVQKAEPVVIEKMVTNTVEKIVATEVTNTVEKVVERPVMVTNTVEKIVATEVTNTVEKIVERPVMVTNTVEKVVEKMVTNTVEKVIEKPITVTNTVEKIVEKVIQTVVTNTIVEKATAATSDDAKVKLTPVPVETVARAANDGSLKSQVPPGFRIWTDYNGRRIIAKWVSVSADETGISILTRYGRRIDAVLWKFSEEDQAYIKSEIKHHTARGEVLNDGKWERNPMLRGAK